MKKSYDTIEVVEKATGNLIKIKGSHFEDALHAEVETLVVETPKAEAPKAVEVEAPKVEAPKKKATKSKKK